MACQTQQSLRSLSLKRLGVVGFINNKQCSRFRKVGRQLGPAVQCAFQIKRLNFSQPVRVKAHRSDHHQAQRDNTQKGTGRKQDRECLAEPHLVSE